MTGPASTVGCPNGHKSIDLVFCSVCGTPIGGRALPEFTTTPPPGGQPDEPGPPAPPAPGPLPEPGSLPGAAPRPEPGPFPEPGPLAGAAPHLDPGPFPEPGPLAGAGSLPEPSPLPEAGSLPEPSPLPGAGPLPDRGPATDPGPTPEPDSVRSTPTAGRPPRHLASSEPEPPPNPGPGPQQRRPERACPNCSAELDAGTRFCEVCGYDPTTGSLPQAPVVRPADPLWAPPAAPAAPPAPTPGPPPGPPPGPAPGAVRPVAVVTADRPYYDSNHVSEVQFPLGAPARAIELPPGPVNIGRRSRSRGTEPHIDLAGPPEDPAVSHTHASLLPKDDGTWDLVDHGSTNGTYVNESPQPVPANHPVPLGPGDRIYLGAWTRITLEIR